MANQKGISILLLNCHTHNVREQSINILSGILVVYCTTLFCCLWYNCLQNSIYYKPPSNIDRQSIQEVLFLKRLRILKNK
jgi:hypothetical protein